MSTNKEESFLSRIKGKLHKMHPTERRLADFLLSFPGELASYTATELARLAGVSNATVTRFIKKLGYKSYDEARRHVRTDKKTGAAIYLVGSRPKDPDELIEAHISQAKENIDLTFATTNLSEIDDLAQTILIARRVWIVGFRTSFAFANYFQWQILQVVENVNIIPQSGHTLAEHVAGMSPDDCVIFFGLQRQIKGNADLLGHIQATRAKVAFLSDGIEKRQKGLDWHFRCGTGAPGPLFNHVAVVALLHLIAVRVIELAGPSGRKRMTAVESLHDALQDI